MRSADRCILLSQITHPSIQFTLFINGEKKKRNKHYVDEKQLEYLCAYFASCESIYRAQLFAFIAISLSLNRSFFFSLLCRHFDWFVVDNVFISFSFVMPNAWPLEWTKKKTLEVNSVHYAMFPFRDWNTFEMRWRQPSSYRICDGRDRQGAYY